MMVDPRIHEITHAQRWCDSFIAESYASDRTVEAIKSYRPAAVIHLAGRDRSDMSLLDGMAYWETDVSSSIRLARACAGSGVKAFMLASTCDIYLPSENCLDERANVAPRSAHTSARAATEMLIADLARASGLTSVAMRFSSVGGAISNPASVGPLRGRSGLINRMIESHAHGSPFNIHGRDWPTGDGTPEIDLLHVHDAASALVLSLEWALSNRGSHAFNTSTGRHTTVQQLVDTAEAILGAHLPYRYMGKRPQDAGWARFSPNALTAATGWVPKMTTEDVIRDSIQWYGGPTYASYAGLRIGHRFDPYR